MINKHDFEDAQLLAKAAVESVDQWWRDAYWRAAMQTLKMAYGVKPCKN